MLYSTLDHVKGQNYRDIIITSTIEFGDEVKRVINRLSDSYSIEILEEKVFVRSANNIDKEKEFQISKTVYGP